MKKLLLLLLLSLLTVPLQAQYNAVEWRYVDIDSNTTHSALVDLRGQNVKLIAVAVGDTNWTTANITIAPYIKIGSTWTLGQFLDEDETEYTLTVGAIAHLQVYYVKPIVAASLEYFEFRSGTYGTPVTQTDTRRIYYAVRAY